MLRRIPTIGRTYRHIARYGEILAVFVKYGFGGLVAALRFERYLPRGMRRLATAENPDIRRLSNGDRLRMAFTELGPTFVKLGQFMSNRPDVLPPDIVSALRELQDSVTPFPAEESALVVEKEFGRPASELFESFSTEPFA